MRKPSPSSSDKVLEYTFDFLVPTGGAHLLQYYNALTGTLLPGRINYEPII